MWQSTRRHGAPIASLAITVGVWLWPVLSQWHDVVPGAGAGDNLTFVWNVWWMRTALHHADYRFFHCPLIFYPFGVDLALHTHTALPAFLAAVLAPGASLLAAQNVLIAVHLFLNCAVAYALAFSLVRHVGGALSAAIVFGWSPYVSAHLMGHFNLVAAWVLPLIALFALRAINGDRAARWLLGASLAITAYVDYYYAVYGVLLVSLGALTPPLSVSFREACGSRQWQRRVGAVLLLVLVIDVLVIATIAWTGGTILRLGGVRVSVLRIANPLSAGWIVLGILAAVWWIPRIRVTLDSARLLRNVKTLAIPAVVLTIAAVPVLLGAFRLWRSGDYVTQRYFWRSAPRGIDTATLLLGNPYGILTGSVATAAYRRLGIDPIEQIGWLGPGVIVLAAIGLLRHRQRADVRILTVIAAVFLVWSLGPYLMAFGRSTAMILPATAVRFVPLVSNARIPGRAFVIVYMAAAILSAWGLASLARSTHVRSRAAALALAALVVADYAPVSPPTFAPGHPAAYDAIEHGGAAGAVLELPLGLRDGFGESGRFDPRILYYQSVHERPTFGGFVARLPPSLLEQYRALPIVGPLLRLSQGASLKEVSPDESRPRAGAALEALGVQYVVVNYATAPPDLLAYVSAVLPLLPVARDDERIVYKVMRGTA